MENSQQCLLSTVIFMVMDFSYWSTMALLSSHYLSHKSICIFLSDTFWFYNNADIKSNLCTSYVANISTCQLIDAPASSKHLHQLLLPPEYVCVIFEEQHFLSLLSYQELKNLCFPTCDGRLCSFVVLQPGKGRWSRHRLHSWPPTDHLYTTELQNSRR